MIRLLTRIISLLCLCAAAHAQSAIEIIDYGAAPRTPIRYQFQPGQSERTTIEMIMSGTSEVNGEQTPVADTPPIRTTMSARVTEVAADGSARVEFKSESAEAGATDNATTTNQADLNRTLKMESQLSGWYRTDNRGHVTDSGASLPESPMSSAVLKMADELSGGAEGTPQQFPDEAVGVGARWRTTMNRDLGPLKLVQTQEYTLRSRSANEVTLDVKNHQQLAGTVPNAEMSSVSESNGSGTTIINLNKLVPTSTMVVDSTSTVTLPLHGKPQTQKTHAQMRMSTVPATE